MGAFDGSDAARAYDRLNSHTEREDENSGSRSYNRSGPLARDRPPQGWPASSARLSVKCKIWSAIRILSA